jgi:nitroreductase
METWKATDSIRVVREFSSEPIEPEQLKRILDAGRRAGSSKNLQRWHFIVVRDRDRLKRLSEVGNFAQPIAGAMLAVALVTPDPHAPDAPLSVVFDLGRAAQNMVLAAWELGIGSVPATVYDHDLARELLGYPDDHHCEYILSFGHPSDPSELNAPKKAGGRAKLEEITHEERWSTAPH